MRMMKTKKKNMMYNDDGDNYDEMLIQHQASWEGKNKWEEEEEEKEEAEEEKKEEKEEKE